MLAISWLSAAMRLLARNPEAAAGFTFFVAFLPYPSSAFVPVATMPTWLHGFASNQPCTPIIETIRSTLAGHPDGGSAARAAAWCLGLLAVGVAGSVAAFRRRTT